VIAVAAEKFDALAEADATLRLDGVLGNAEPRGDFLLREAVDFFGA